VSSDIESPRRLLLEIYAAALARVEGGAAVRRALETRPLAGPVWIIAIGKAAAAMSEGALSALGKGVRGGLVVTKQGHLTPRVQRDTRLECLEAEHPVPGPGSLTAGRRLLEVIAALPDDAEPLFLISGGASSLVEVLPQGMDLEDLAALNRRLLGAGADIATMNGVRRAVSLIKGGRLLGYLGARRVRALLISDVPGDDPAVIGSGLLVPSPPAPLAELPEAVRPWAERVPPPAASSATAELEIVACLRDALDAAAEAGRAHGLAVHVEEAPLAGDAEAAGRRLARALLEGPPGLGVWGGETAVTLPARPGRGGRNQHLALAAATVLAGHAGSCLLAAGTDGTDGPTEEAGALVDGGTLRRGAVEGLDAEASLRAADSGRFLEASGDLLRTGPTGTNVMDLALGLRLETA
jgi:hydroxypyruvate reductase